LFVGGEHPGGRRGWLVRDGRVGAAIAAE
jgi:hypothetical protein